MCKQLKQYKAKYDDIIDEMLKLDENKWEE